MKKKLLLISLFLVNSYILLDVSEAHAETTSQAKSLNSIKFLEGGSESTNPVNPIDPDLPVEVDPVDPNNPGTNNPGPLSIDFISNIQFGNNKINGKDTVYSALNKSPYVQVTDVRGTEAGWELKVAASEFTSTKNPKDVLKGAELTFKNAAVKSASKGNVSQPPTSSDVTLINSDAQTIMNADENQGSGTWLSTWTANSEVNENVQLKVLSGSAKANTEYTAELNWSLSDAPK